MPSILGNSNERIQIIEKTKFLGVQIFFKMNFTDHIDSINKKINSTCYLMRQLRKKISFEALKSVYYAYIHSLLLYGLVLWGNTPLAKQVFINQKRAIRILKNVPNRTSCKDLFTELKITTLPGLYIYEILKLVKKTPENFPILKQETKHHNTRYRSHSELNLKIEPHITAFYEKSIQFNAAKIFNVLPIGMKEMETKPFLNLVKDYVETKTFYSLEEFLKDI